MQTNESQNSIESMAALARGWCDVRTPPLPEECLEAAREVKALLDKRFPHLKYQMFPGAGGFVAFEFDEASVVGGFELWVYGENSGHWATADRNDEDYEWKTHDEFIDQFLLHLIPPVYISVDSGLNTNKMLDYAREFCKRDTYRDIRDHAGTKLNVEELKESVAKRSEDQLNERYPGVFE